MHLDRGRQSFLVVGSVPWVLQTSSSYIIEHGTNCTRRETYMCRQRLFLYPYRPNHVSNQTTKSRIDTKGTLVYPQGHWSNTVVFFSTPEQVIGIQYRPLSEDRHRSCNILICYATSKCHIFPLNVKDVLNDYRDSIMIPNSLSGSTTAPALFSHCRRA